MIYDWSNPIRQFIGGIFRDRRHRLAIISTGVSGLAKLSGIIVTIITVPMTLRYLGMERYGAWVTITSFLTMLVFADLGIGNGVLNEVSKAYGARDIVRIRVIIFSGFVALFAIGGIVTVGYALLSPYIPYGRLFHVSDSKLVLDIRNAMFWTIVCFAISIPASIIQRVQMGLQMIYVSEAWQIVKSGCVLLATWMCIKLQYGLVSLVFATLGVPIVISVLNAAVFFVRSRPDLMPVSTHIEYNVVRSIVGFGFAFFIIQIGMSLGSASDNLLITNVLGPEASAAFAIPQKMYGAVSIIVMMSILPLWPAYGEAIAVGDNRWVVFTLWRSLVTSVVFATIASVVLTIFAQRIMFVWTGVNLQVGIDLFVALCIWQIVLTAGNAIAMFVNGTSYLVARQAYISVIAGAAMIAGKYFALREIGMSGVVWGGIGAYVLFSGIPTGYLVYRAIEQLKRGKVGESTGSRALVA